MTVAELIVELQKLPQDLPVYYSGRDYETTDVASVEILALGAVSAGAEHDESYVPQFPHDYRMKIWPERVMLT